MAYGFTKQGLDALEPLNTRLEPQHGVRVAVRLSLHTGLAVIGAVGSGMRQEALAMGDTPNIAARIQGLAGPNTAALSATTARLVQGAFALEELGIHHFKGVTEPMLVCRVIDPLQGYSDEVMGVPAPGPFLVGRNEEVGLLRRRWEQSKEGLRQVVLVSGCAGEGFRLLAEALAVMDTTSVRDFKAEIYRLQGELLLAQSADNYAEAEACLSRALALAHRQQAKAWELRAAMSLSRLW